MYLLLKSSRCFFSIKYVKKTKIFLSLFDYYSGDVFKLLTKSSNNSNQNAF